MDARKSPVYGSFWQVGFEGADHVNGSGEPLQLLEATRHVMRVAEDYAQLGDFGIRTVRESIGWRSVASARGFDFSDVRRRAEAARRLGVQILWTCMHYGVPADVDLFSPQLISRFARYCEALARCLKPYCDGELPPVFTPINEISFFSWAVCETGLMHPYRGDMAHRAFEFKKQMVRAAIVGSDAILSILPHARLLHVDPLVHVVAPAGRPDLAEAARVRSDLQFQAWDMLCGRIEPQLGGHDRYLDLIGVNYYPNNQWEYGTDARLWWHLRDPRRLRFSDLLAGASARYRRPLTIAETSHLGARKAQWVTEIVAEVEAARAGGTGIEGICLYPAIDRPDWEDPKRWHDSGLWSVDSFHPDLPRRLDPPYAAALREAQRRLEPKADSPRGQAMNTLIVFSHLRWDFVFQRPQHILTRLAKTRRVLFVEEPVYDNCEPIAEILDPVLNVSVLRPHTRSHAPGFHDDQIAAVGRMVIDQLKADRETRYSVWFYTPMALPLLEGLSPDAIVYDCMDELSAFAAAPPQLLSREATLLRIANLVFTGGPSLNEAKSRQRDDVHCFSSSVDLLHFEKGADPSLAHPALAALSHPRLGYFGVIDERFDAPLVAHLAASRPQWQIVLVGPIVKIDPASLPQAANIHYLPQQPYAALPSLLSGWDLCLIPFALNAATRFVSPTKTLEYMAALKPIVSTAITDVISLYGDAVQIACDAQDFVIACERALSEAPAQRLRRVQIMRSLTGSTSWDVTAERMRELLDAAEATGLSAAAKTYLASPKVVGITPSTAAGASAVPRSQCLILGAGPTGLSASWHFGPGCRVIERNPTVGGWCRSIEQDGFQFDHAGHIMFSNDAHVHDMYKMLLGDNVHWQEREAWIYSHGVHTRYPFQGCLYGLPPSVLKECLVGAIEARFGPIDGKTVPDPAPRPLAANKPYVDGPQAIDCCADGMVPNAGMSDERQAGAAPVITSEGPSGENFEQFIYRVWGAGVAKHFAIPYNTKLWAVPLSEMETSWLGGRVPLPDLAQMIEGAVRPSPKPMGPNARFGYPLRGGFQALMDGFLPHLRGGLLLDAGVERVHPRKKMVELADGRRFGYQHLISTIPLPELIKAIGSQAPADIHAATAALRHVSVRCVNIGVACEKVTDKHWIYYPEDTVFHRIFVQSNASPHCSPPGGFGFTCEITHAPGKPLPADGDALNQLCIDDCIRVGMIEARDRILVANQVEMPYAYVVYDHARRHNVELIRAWLREYDIHLAGRYSEWEYYNSDHAFLAGQRAARTVKEALDLEAAQVLASDPDKLRPTGSQR